MLQNCKNDGYLLVCRLHKSLRQLLVSAYSPPILWFLMSSIVTNSVDAAVKMTSHHHSSKFFFVPPSISEDRRMHRCYSMERIRVTARDNVNTEWDGRADLSANDKAAKEGLLETARRLKKLQGLCGPNIDGDNNDPMKTEWKKLYNAYMVQSANALKEILASRKLKKKGRKPDLASRLAQYDMEERYPEARTFTFRDDTETASFRDDIERLSKDKIAEAVAADKDREQVNVEVDQSSCLRFGGIGPLSNAAGKALKIAGFDALGPSPIQTAAMSRIARGESVILHAETGSGKTLAYLLPVTEQIWSEDDQNRQHRQRGVEGGYCLILTPTRELATQVAGVASVLSPQGSVRFITKPTNIMDVGRDVWDDYGGKRERAGGAPARIIVGSAKAVMYSLYGDGRMPAAPTPKPLAVEFLKSVRWIILDEVDRILDVKKGRTEKKKARNKRHEKPGAIVAAAVARFTYGKAQLVAASATVGRPLRRELARVLGLPPQECPDVVRGRRAGGADSAIRHGEKETEEETEALSGRAVTIPSAVENYVFPVDGSTPGSLLTSAAFVAKALPLSADRKGRKVLLVLSGGCGLAVHNTVGALRHFGVQPSPRALLDALEADTSDRLIDIHRKVSGSTGVGGSSSLRSQDNGSTGSTRSEGYLLVTSENNIRGLHLDGLDTIIVVGRPEGPDEYSHVAGRTGRMGRRGVVINVVSYEQAAALTSWERMLNVDFTPVDMSDISKLE